MSIRQTHAKTSQSEQPLFYPSYSESVFTAVKTLKQQQQHLINVNNRIRKLQIKQLKNLSRCQNNRKLMMSLQKIREEKQRSIQQVNRHRSLVRTQIQEQNLKNNKEKSKKKLTIMTAFEEIKNKRHSAYEQMKQKRRENGKKLIIIRQLELGQRKQARDKVVDDQNKMKYTMMKRLESKKQNMQNNNEIQVQQIRQKGKRTELQIQKLSIIELQLLQRHSQSQTKQNQVRERYLKFTKGQKVTLSPLGRKDSQQTTYVHPLVKRVQKRIAKLTYQNAR